MTHPRAIILVRHGQSEHHVRGLSGGWTDTSLTAVGHEQAQRVAARLKEELGGDEVAIYTSDLLRAGETARHVAEAFGVEPLTDDRLREHNNGDAVDRTIAQVESLYPEASSRSIWDPEWRAFPGAETGAEFFARSASFLDSLPAEGPLPILVTHGGTIMCMVGHWLHMQPHQLARIVFPAFTTSITTLVRDQRDRHEVERLNDVAHLAGMAGWGSLRDLVRPV